MKNLMNCAKNAIICVVMVFVLLFNSVTSAHAVTLEAGIAIASFCYTVLRDAVTDEEKSEAIEILESLWRSSPNSVSYIEVTADELQSLYVELNGMGFPCRITQRYIAGQWCFCIEGTGYVEVLPDSYFWFHGYEESNISGDVFTNLEGWAYVSNVPMTSNEYIKYIYNEFGTYIDGIETKLDDLLYRLTKIYDFITGYTDAAGNTPGTNLYDKMDEIVTAIEGISDSAANFDTTPIVDKLEEVITSADENFTTAIESIDSNGGRLDTLIEEVRKISTYDARQEVEVVIPGVFGDIHSWKFPDDWRLSQGRDQITISYNGSAERNVSYDSPPTVVSTAEVLDAQTSSGFYEWYICDYMDGMYEVARATIDDEAMSFTGGSLYVEAYGFDGNCVKSITSYGSESSLVMDLSEVASLHIYTNEDFVFFDSFGPNFPLVEVEFGNYVDVGCQELTFQIDGEWHTLDFGRESFTVLPGSSICWDEAIGWHFIDADGVDWRYVDCADQLTDAFTPPDTTEIQLMGNIFSWFEWFYNNQSTGEPGGLLDVTPIVNKLKDIENALSNMGSNIDIENNTNININEGDENYNIFYVDDPDGGEDKSIVDLSGDTLTVFGKLLNFLYKVGFKGALDNAGGGIGDLSDFYLDTSEGSADLWVS